MQTDLGTPFHKGHRRLSGAQRSFPATASAKESGTIDYLPLKTCLCIGHTRRNGSPGQTSRDQLSGGLIVRRCFSNESRKLVLNRKHGCTSMHLLKMPSHC